MIRITINLTTKTIKLFIKFDRNREIAAKLLIIWHNTDENMPNDQ